MEHHVQMPAHQLSIWTLLPAQKISPAKVESKTVPLVPQQMEEIPTLRQNQRTQMR